MQAYRRGLPPERDSCVELLAKYALSALGPSRTTALTDMTRH
jgi:hypothetical protein